MLMNTRHLIAGAICAAAFTTPALAADEATANLGVAAVVADTCILAAATPLGFATINTQEASSQVTPGLVTVTCTASRGAITVTLDGGGNLICGRLALHENGPEQDMARKPVGEAVQNIANDRAGRRCDDADDLRQEWQRSLPAFVEEAFRCQFLAAFFK